MKFLFTTQSLFQWRNNFFISEKSMQSPKKLSYLFSDWFKNGSDVEFIYLLVRAGKNEIQGKLCSAESIYFDHRLDTINIKLNNIRDLSNNEIVSYIEKFNVDKNKSQLFYCDSEILKYRPEFEAGNREKHVKQLQAFIAEILKNKLDDEEYTTFYRGHGNRDFELLPSIYRKNGEGKSLEKSEHLIFRELQIFNPSEFDGDKSTFDKLVRMQHYSLPTRLLDLTTNPLVALFFACCEFKDNENFKIGQVLKIRIKNSLLKYFDSDSVSTISNLARLDYDSKISIDFSKSTIEEFNDLEQIKKLTHFIRDDKPYFLSKIAPSDLQKVLFLKSKQSNERIISQSGCFAIFGQDAKIDEGDGVHIERIDIYNKSSILDELDKININERTIFPSIDKSSIYLKNKYFK